MPAVASNVGERIRLRRHQLGLTQEELARRTGVSTSAVLNWEKGNYFPSRHQGKVEAILGISLTAASPPEPPADPTERKLWDLAIQDMSAEQAWEVIEEYRRRRRRTA